MAVFQHTGWHTGYGLEIPARAIFFLSALFCSFLVVFILGFMVLTGLPILEHSQWVNILTGDWNPVRQSYGIWPMVLGTLWISF
ncbi:MAG: hypothetical protein RBR67_21375, partial [Desulfobacterium sp.]|nr:hypothetical protein [Desulfobacterium sp.]